jgi:hypothetical protein
MEISRLMEEKQLEKTRNDKEYCDKFKDIIDKMKVENCDQANEVNRNWIFVLESERMTARNTVSNLFTKALQKDNEIAANKLEICRLMQDVIAIVILENPNIAV